MMQLDTVFLANPHRESNFGKSHCLGGHLMLVKHEIILSRKSSCNNTQFDWFFVARDNVFLKSQAKVVYYMTTALGISDNGSSG